MQRSGHLLKKQSLKRASTVFGLDPDHTLVSFILPNPAKTWLSTFSALGFFLKPSTRSELRRALVSDTMFPERIDFVHQY
jgi:hypothetical protein